MTLCEVLLDTSLCPNSWVLSVLEKCASARNTHAHLHVLTDWMTNNPIYLTSNNKSTTNEKKKKKIHVSWTVPGLGLPVTSNIYLIFLHTAVLFVTGWVCLLVSDKLELLVLSLDQWRRFLSKPKFLNGWLILFLKAVQNYNLSTLEIIYLIACLVGLLLLLLLLCWTGNVWQE